MEIHSTLEQETGADTAQAAARGQIMKIREICIKNNKNRRINIVLCFVMIANIDAVINVD